MPQRYPDTLNLTRKFLRILVGLNILMGIGILALFIASLVDGPYVMRALGVRVADAAGPFATGMRVIMIMGIISVPFTHVVLTRLQAIVETVRAGDPFVRGNAARLLVIARAVLALEVTHIVVGLAAAGVFSAQMPISIGWRFSLTRWLAILLLFVLARVFEQGARMREDLEGTV
jgi:hypothetical protein